MPDTIPTVAGFTAWAQAVMGITTAVMPSNDPGWADAFSFAQQWVPMDINGYAPQMYTACVYNYAGSLLLQYQQDQTGQNFFVNARKQFGITNFLPGVISTASNEATSETSTVGDGLKNLQAIDLLRVKDPYGRQAVAIMQSTGTLWGLN